MDYRLATAVFACLFVANSVTGVAQVLPDVPDGADAVSLMGKPLVSSEPSEIPSWGTTSDELFYVSSGELITVSLALDPTPRVQSRTRLFAVPRQLGGSWWPFPAGVRLPFWPARSAPAWNPCCQFPWGGWRAGPGAGVRR